MLPLPLTAVTGMKEASECLAAARRCEGLANQTNDASSTRLLHVIAEQWRKLAQDAERHKRMTWTGEAERSGS